MDRQDKMERLAQGIQKARKVMEEVEHRSGNKSFGNQPGRQVYTEQDTDTLFVDNTQYISESEAMQRRNQIAAPSRNTDYGLYEDNERPLPIEQPQNTQPKFVPYKNINNSKMPREILESFMQTPPIDPTQPLGMETLFEKVKGTQPQPQVQRRAAEPIVEYRTQQAPVTESKGNIDTHLLEYVIKKTVEETLKQVQEQTNINENIQIKIGDKTFGGKISSLKKIK
jgi:hypothetical protein